MIDRSPEQVDAFDQYVMSLFNSDLRTCDLIMAKAAEDSDICASDYLRLCRFALAQLYLA